ncbi:DUF3492 domain-containing protein [Streptomyces sp. OF3]|uniref:D-inositol 3-phosphate glycosyltransferase n=1 Tax=Streptomyces alkaliterrae TaxID=2213162 RepID=A0A7W3WPZ6_9ACTN|nr:DUF3492 domain-containing protein [Streptomyces alkaliterrae]MBB1256175.1 DUF3492 domain-containing protein [Streptomyces alkaliterrae]
MRVALLTEGGYPYTHGESVVWCDRLVRGLSGHGFEVYALSRSRRQEEAGWLGAALPAHVRRVRTARLWGPARPARTGGRGGPAARRQAFARRFDAHFEELARAVCAPDEADAAGRPAVGASPGRGPAEDRFAEGLYGLADLAAEYGDLTAALCSEQTVRLLEAACRAPGAPRAVRTARVADLLAVAERLERALRPLSLDWHLPSPRGEDTGLARVDLCHAVGGGVAALPGLLARRLHGTPLLLTEYGVRLREHYLSGLAGLLDPADGAPRAGSAAVRALLGSFQRRLATEAYRTADLITPGNTHTRGWQVRCGAARERLRTVYPGMDSARLLHVPEDDGEPVANPLLVWVGPLTPAKDPANLLHAFAEIRRVRPTARLLVVETRPGAGGDNGYAAHYRALADRLAPPPHDPAVPPPVVFERLGGPAAPTLAEVYAGASVVLLSSAVEGFPPSLVEAMFCGRATVSTDTGAVREVIGGTGLVVPPGDPRALAEAALALLADSGRRARLGAAARARAAELFTVEQNVTAFRGIYLELMSRHPVRGGADRVTERAPRPFERTAESAGLPEAPAGPDATGPRTAGPGSTMPDTVLPGTAAPPPAPGGSGAATTAPRRVPSWARDPAAAARVPDRRTETARGATPVAAGAGPASGGWEGAPE